MFDFIKKMINAFNGNQSESDLMSRAVDSAMQGKTGMFSSALSSLSSKSDYHDDMDQLMYQMHVDEQMEQMHRDMHDPYLNPGQDFVVDEVYHGIDHGNDHHY